MQLGNFILCNFNTLENNNVSDLWELEVISRMKRGTKNISPVAKKNVRNTRSLDRLNKNKQQTQEAPWRRVINTKYLKKKSEIYGVPKYSNTHQRTTAKTQLELLLNKKKTLNVALYLILQEKKMFSQPKWTYV